MIQEWAAECTQLELRWSADFYLLYAKSFCPPTPIED